MAKVYLLERYNVNGGVIADNPHNFSSGMNSYTSATATAFKAYYFKATSTTANVTACANSNGSYTTHGTRTTIESTSTVANLADVSSMGITRTGYHVNTDEEYLVGTSSSASTTIVSQRGDSATKYKPTASRIGASTTSNTTKYFYVNWQQNKCTIKLYPNASNVYLVGNGGSSLFTGYFSKSNVIYTDTTTIQGMLNSEASMTSGTATLTRSGYDFLGWSESSSATTATYTNTKVLGNFADTRNETISLYAVWAEKKYTLTVSPSLNGTSYSSTGGSVTGGGSYTVGTNVTLRATANSDYEFVKWTSSNGTQLSTSNPYTYTTTDSNVTIYGVFKSKVVVNYTVTFKSGSTTLGTQSISAGVSTALTTASSLQYYSNRPTNNNCGWIFNGWAESYGTSSYDYVDGGYITITKATTLYAIFRRQISYMYYNNTTSVSGTANQYFYNSSSSYTTVTSITLPALSNNTTYGWIAGGWTLAINGSRVITTTSSTTVAPAYNLNNNGSSGAPRYYAYYSRTVTLSYNSNGGSGTMTNSTTTQYCYGTTVQSTSITLKNNSFTAPSNKLFAYWARESISGTAYDEGDSFDISALWSSNATYTVYAIWDEPTYTLTVQYHLNGGIFSDRVHQQSSSSTNYYTHQINGLLYKCNSDGSNPVLHTHTYTCKSSESNSTYVDLVNISSLHNSNGGLSRGERSVPSDETVAWRTTPRGGTTLSSAGGTVTIYKLLGNQNLTEDKTVTVYFNWGTSGPYYLNIFYRLNGGNISSVYSYTTSGGEQRYYKVGYPIDVSDSDKYVYQCNSSGGKAAPYVEHYEFSATSVVLNLHNVGNFGASKSNFTYISSKAYKNSSGTELSQADNAETIATVGGSTVADKVVVLYVNWQSGGAVYIKTGTNTWSQGTVYVKTSSGWVQGIPYVLTSSGWRQGV